MQGKKVHQVHFALDVARYLNLDAVHVVETFVEEGVQVVLRRILNEPCSFEFEVQYSVEALDVLAVLWKFSILDVMMISCRRVPGMFKVFLLSLKNQMSLGFGV